MRWRIRENTGLLLAAAVAVPCLAQTPAERVAVSAVTLYPGAALIERVAHVAPNATEVAFDCLATGLDAQTLRAEGAPGIRVGEIRVTKVTPSTGLPACRHTVVDDRIRALEDARATVTADEEANEVLATYLKSIKGSTDDRSGGVTDLRNLSASADVLRRTAETAFSRRQAFSRKLEELDRQLAELNDERDRLNIKNREFTKVIVSVRAEKPGDLRLTYLVNQAGWTPTYRAELDTTTGTLAIERQALIAQSTGEVWAGVRMRLSTVQPRAGVAPPIPSPWQVGIAHERVAVTGSAIGGFAPPPPMSAPAPSAVAALKRDAASAAAEPLFDTSVFQGVYATEFPVTTPVTLPSDGQQLAVTLDHFSAQASLTVLTTPRQGASAFLLAELERPPGVWPRGPLALVRDGASIGTIPNWTGQDKGHVTIAFGRDDLVKVTVEPKANFDASAGVFGGRSERRISGSYDVENLHRSPIALEILEASPVSTDEQVEVKKTFVPPVSVDGWEDRPGVVAWRMTVPAQGKVHVEAQYVITAPKDVRTTGF